MVLLVNCLKQARRIEDREQRVLGSRIWDPGHLNLSLWPGARLHELENDSLSPTARCGK